MSNSQKLEFNRSFKTDHTPSSYLDLTRGTAGRRALVKLRMSNHKLMIKIGRYNQTTKDNRHCLFCGCNVMEDEVHFLFQCPTYCMITNEFYYVSQDSDSKYYPVTYERFGMINELIWTLLVTLSIYSSQNTFQFVLMFVTKYYQSNVIALCCNFWFLNWIAFAILYVLVWSCK